MVLRQGEDERDFDGDFRAARTTDEGIDAAMKIKFDTDSRDFLGLGQ